MKAAVSVMDTVAFLRLALRNGDSRHVELNLFLKPEILLLETTYPVWQTHIVPRKSVVQVSFAGRNTTLSYYNDLFDLHPGDLVYVDGKLEGHRGRVTDVNYNFKIKVSDYKRVIAVVDTTVNGQFFMAGSHFVTFDRAALPANKAVTWFKAPAKEGEEIVSGSDDSKAVNRTGKNGQ